MTQGRCKMCHTRWMWWRDVNLISEGLYHCPRRHCDGILFRTSRLCKDRVAVHPFNWLRASRTEAEILGAS